MRRATWRLLLALTLALPGVAETAKPLAVPTVKRAELWNTEQFLFHSPSFDRDFLIQVARPFWSNQAKLPAVYVLDGNQLFMTAAAVAASNAKEDGYAPAWFIGIGYPDQDIAHWQTVRSADFTHHVYKSDIKTGDGPKFEKFMIEELRPALEKRYAIDPTKNILVGYSLGGLFATQILLHTPGAFQTYLIGSPSLWVEPSLLADARAFTSTDAPKRVFVGVGADDADYMVKGTHDLADALRRDGDGVTLQEWIIPDERHLTAQLAFLARALRFALPQASTIRP